MHLLMRGFSFNNLVVFTAFIFLFTSNVIAGPFDYVAKEKATPSPGLDLLYFAEVESISSPASFMKAVGECENETYTSERQNYICALASVDIQRWDHLGRSIDLSSNTQVLFFGEKHLDQGTQFEFANLLYVLKAQGYSTLAMEMFPKSTQGNLDLYNRGQMSLDDIIEVLGRHWSYSKEGYRAILTTARVLNIKVIGIDDRTNPLKLDFWADFYSRDNVMAKNLANEIAKKNNKMIVYTGSLHTMKSFGYEFSEQTLTQKFHSELQKQGLEVTTQNYIFRNSEFSKAFKGLTELYREHKAEDIMITSDEFSQYADAVIYLQPGREKQLAFNSQK